ncbi:hypothetical protein BDZ91DRAFT_451071 [Kalaharituber pfeilii]|nr:hypothetical protein BDZ91DRAFT_451071 [Kalaharituber pfeilii]
MSESINMSTPASETAFQEHLETWEQKPIPNGQAPLIEYRQRILGKTARYCGENHRLLRRTFNDTPLRYPLCDTPLSVTPQRHCVQRHIPSATHPLNDTPYSRNAVCIYIKTSPPLSVPISLLLFPTTTLTSRRPIYQLQCNSLTTLYPNNPNNFT